jgi:hypothetical protein
MIKYFCMSKQVEEISKYLKNLEDFSLPTYEEFPPIPLYMEQVVSYVTECLCSLTDGDDNSIITPFMVNNYVKARIINPPKEKKYNKEHMAYLLAISLLKSVVPMKDIATFIDLDKEIFQEKRNLYNFFKEIQDETIHKEVHKTKVRLDSLAKNNKKKSSNSKTKEDIENLNLSYIALRLYIESETTKQLADIIMKQVSQELLPKDVLKETRKEVALGNKKQNKEAKKIGNR